MSIITFKSDEQKETGQTLSLVATATQMAIEHNYKILIVSTSFRDKTLESCFWELDKEKKPIFSSNRMTAVGIDSGTEGLIRGLVSSKTNPAMVKDYSKTVLRDRLDVLVSPNSETYQDYEKVAENYPEILKIANRYYDMIFVDLTRRMDTDQAKRILDISDVVIMNMTQRLRNIDEVMALRKEDDFYKQRNVMLLIGRYDSHSKYNVKNVTRYMKEKTSVLAIPYNTLYFEACSEGKAVDFFLRLKRLDPNDRNAIFLKGADDVVEAIIKKLQELQTRI